jgi:hypothetical protein
MKDDLQRFGEIIRRLIIKVYPEVVGYKLIEKDRKGIWALVVIYKPKTTWNDETDEFEEVSPNFDWNRIAELTKSLFNMVGMDDRYILAAVGKSPTGTEVDNKWIWKKDMDNNWRDHMNRTLEFRKNDANQNT